MSLWRKLRSLSTIKDQIDLTKLFPTNQKDLNLFPEKLANPQSLENQLSENNKSFSEIKISVKDLERTTSQIKTSTELAKVLENPYDIIFSNNISKEENASNTNSEDTKSIKNNNGTKNENAKVELREAQSINKSDNNESAKSNHSNSPTPSVNQIIQKKLFDDESIHETYENDDGQVKNDSNLNESIISLNNSPDKIVKNESFDNNDTDFNVTGPSVNRNESIKENDTNLNETGPSGNIYNKNESLSNDSSSAFSGSASIPTDSSLETNSSNSASLSLSAKSPSSLSNITAVNSSALVPSPTHLNSNSRKLSLYKNTARRSSPPHIDPIYI